MDTLLAQVQTIEETARDRVAQVEREGKERVAQLLEGESVALRDVRQRAEKKAEQIVGEARHEAENEINALRQDHAAAVQGITVQAAARREAAVTFVVDLFERAYLSDQVTGAN